MEIPEQKHGHLLDEKLLCEHGYLSAKNYQHMYRQTVLNQETGAVRLWFLSIQVDKRNDHSAEV